MKPYQTLMAQIEAKNTEIKTIFDEAGDEALDSATYKRVVDGNKQIEEWELEAKELIDQESARNAANRRADELKRPAPGAALGVGSTGLDGSAAQARGRKSIGEQFVSDPAFAAWFKKEFPTGRVPDRGSVKSPAVQFGGLKTLVTGLSSTSGGALVDNQFLGLQDMGTFMRPLTIRDLVTNGQTSSDTVEYVRFGTPTNNAATVAEATATSGSTGAKPESAIAMSVIAETVKTIAHWIPITRRAFADAGQIRTIIDNFLRYGLEEELEDQMITGDGVGENFTGILNVTGTQSQAFSVDLLTTTRKARTKVRVTGRAVATAYVMNPTDWETIDLLKDSEARYYFGGPSVLGTPRLWGLPVVESEAMTAGTSVVGDWRKAVLWDREQAQILTSDSHSDFFVRNLLAILAELRAAFGVLQPAAFVEIAHS